jgi:hypothetical protein
MATEDDIRDTLAKQQLQLPPLSFRLLSEVPDRIGVILRGSWGERSWKFATELKRLATPKILQDAVNAVRPAAEQSRLNPMIVVPYLSPDNIAFLERSGVSGVDLCGNGIVVVPSELLVVRTGNPNRFPQSAPIRNVYSGDSSLVARAFLATPTYVTVGQIQKTIRDLGGDITLSTVSKVLKAFESDLIVTREKGSIRLVQPEKLLDRLAANYRPPQVKERFVGRIDLGERELQAALTAAARKKESKFVVTGAASANQYAVLAREPVVTVYCSVTPEELLASLPTSAQRTDRFPNLDLIQTTDARVYFDPNTRDGVPYASPVQSYLELTSGDKRQRETAEQVRRLLLGRLQSGGPIA